MFIKHCAKEEPFLAELIPIPEHGLTGMPTQLCSLTAVSDSEITKQSPD
jgi:hypothetical protein